MEQEEKSFLEAFEKKKLPSTLNVLTILTFIGCGFGLIGAILGYVNAQTNYDQMDKLINGGDLDKIPGFLRGFYSQDTLEMTRKALENKLPILIATLVIFGLRLFGAVKMRALKQEGYIAWLISEILPLLINFIFIGVLAFKGFGFWVGLIIIVTFIALYSSQRKHLSK